MAPQMFQKTILKVEQDGSSTSQRHHKPAYPQLKARGEEDTHLYLLELDKLLIKFKSEEVVGEGKLFESVLEFCEAGIKYFKQWKSNFDNADTFSWWTLKV